MPYNLIIYYNPSSLLVYHPSCTPWAWCILNIQYILLNGWIKERYIWMKPLIGKRHLKRDSFMSQITRPSKDREVRGRSILSVDYMGSVMWWEELPLLQEAHGGRNVIRGKTFQRRQESSQEDLRIWHQWMDICSEVSVQEMITHVRMLWWQGKAER